MVYNYIYIITIIIIYYTFAHERMGMGMEASFMMNMDTFLSQKMEYNSLL